MRVTKKILIIQNADIVNHLRVQMGGCRSHQDGDCTWSKCPQNKDGEPNKSGRHCPLDDRGECE